MSSRVPLLAVPNVSEGRRHSTIEAVGQALQGAGGIDLLDIHSDADHNRSVFTLAGFPGALADALLGGAHEAVSSIDVMSSVPQPRGEHPHVGALDVAPIVYLDEAARGAACAEALLLADRIAEQLSVPVFLYGELTETASGVLRTRAQLRRGGVAELARRLTSGELHPDFGPPQLHPKAGATLIAARPPLVAFNLQLAAGATVADARRIASLVREGGARGLPGVRAIGIQLTGAVAQVSMNIERPHEVPLALVLQRVREHALVASGELVGLAPSAAFEDFPEDLSMPGFDPARHLLERVLERTLN